MEARLTEIDRGEMLRYLLWQGGAIPEEVDAALRRGEERLRETAQPRAVWRVFDYRPGEPLGGTAYIPEGEDVRAFSACTT